MVKVKQYIAVLTFVSWCVCDLQFLVAVCIRLFLIQLNLKVQLPYLWLQENNMTHCLHAILSSVSCFRLYPFVFNTVKFKSSIAIPLVAGKQHDSLPACNSEFSFVFPFVSVCF